MHRSFDAIQMFVAELEADCEMLQVHTYLANFEIFTQKSQTILVCLSNKQFSVEINNFKNRHHLRRI